MRPAQPYQPALPSKKLILEDKEKDSLVCSEGAALSDRGISIAMQLMQHL